MDIRTLLGRLVESGGSDLHLKVGSPPIIRSQGQLVQLEGSPLGIEDTRRFADELLTAEKRQQLSEEGDAEVARSFEGLGRYRVNAYLQRGDFVRLREVSVTYSLPQAALRRLRNPVKSASGPITMRQAWFWKASNEPAWRSA